MIGAELESLRERKFDYTEGKGSSIEEDLVFYSDKEKYEESEPFELDVINFESGLTAAATTDIDLRDFRETVESWYPVYKSGELWFSEGEDYRKATPEDMKTLNDAERAHYFFHDSVKDCEFSWIDSQSTDLDEEYNQIAVTAHHDAIRSYFGHIEPLEKVLPELVHSEVSEKDKEQVIVDLFKYLKGEANLEGRDAIYDCSEDLMKEVIL